jgi:hypothetical protein
MEGAKQAWRDGWTTGGEGRSRQFSPIAAAGVDPGACYQMAASRTVRLSMLAMVVTKMMAVTS